MRPAPPPVRDGLGPALVRLRGGLVVDEFRARWGASAAAKVVAGEVVLPDGTQKVPTHPFVQLTPIGG